MRKKKFRTPVTSLYKKTLHKPDTTGGPIVEMGNEMACDSAPAARK
jgi:hypothetical protein